MFPICDLYEGRRDFVFMTVTPEPSSDVARKQRLQDTVPNT